MCSEDSHPSQGIIPHRAGGSSLSPVSYAHSEGAEVLEAAQQAVRSYPSPCLSLLILQNVSNTDKSQKPQQSLNMIVIDIFK